MAEIDVDRARRDTPGCARLIHFNNAGAALMPTPVLDAVVGHLRLEAEAGGYEAAASRETDLDHVYDAVATLLGCHREEIAVVENATRAWDMAFYSIPFAAGDRILTTNAEYASNYIAFLQTARRSGARIEVIPSDADGQVDVAALEEMLDERVKLIAVTHVPTNGGLVNSAEAIGRVARTHGILYLLDACQSVGQMPIDVDQIGCDLLSATGRKYLRGPRGTGFLYVRRSVLDRFDPPFLDLHSAEWVATDRYEMRPDARRFETWETNVAGKIGLGVAVDYALEWGLAEIWTRIRMLADRLRQELSTVPGVRLRDLGPTRCGIVTFTKEGSEPGVIRRRLADEGINVTVSPCRYTRLDMEARGLTEVVRASVHYYNTDDEIGRVVDALRSL